MAKAREREEREEDGSGQKKKHPLGKLLEEFTPKSHRLELGIGAGMSLLIGIGIMGAAPFVPEDTVWMLAGGGVFLLAGLVMGYLSFRGPSSDHVQIRKLGVQFRMSGETIRVGWSEIEYVDSDTQYERDVRRSKSKSTYRAYVGVLGQSSIDLTAEFLRQFEDPALLIKNIRKQIGGTLKHVEMPRGRED